MESELDIKFHQDRYKNLHINIPNIPENKTKVIRKIIDNAIVDNLNTEVVSVWVNVPLPVKLNLLGKILPNDFLIGHSRSNLIYDFQENKVRVWFSYIKEHSIPPGATHNLGGSSLIYDGILKKVLLLVNITRPNKWEFPGGSFDPSSDKDTIDTSIRETFEETGIVINTEQKSRLVGEMLYPNNPFAQGINQLWGFNIPYISEQPLKIQEKEIKKAAFIPISTLLKDDMYDGHSVPKCIKDMLKTFINHNDFVLKSEGKSGNCYTH